MAKTGQTITGTDSAAGLGRASEGRCAGAGDPEMDVATGLVQLTALVQGIYTRVSERHDLTPVQAKLLCVLLDGPRGMADLARCFGVEKAALTGLMNRAERRGLAQRSSVPGDRRALQVTLTDAGHQAAIAFHAEVSAELDRLIASLNDDDREHFRSTMAAIITRCRTSSSAAERRLS
ncbi:MarR family winged helix-turn-helix transcriptional regulator [Nonomuraea sp. CA-141351]|uniref:MarR family winged helix-turn-helix transcriptional regulator n=1 Tax=Nonomuraea sp. CA-141351 TaxID=3239996 RepID=UPI003D8DEC72